MTTLRKQKIATKVAEVQFAGLDEKDVAAALNAPDTNLPKKRVDVPIRAVRTLFLQSRSLARLQILAEKQVADDDPDFVAKTFLREIALTALATLNNEDLTVIPAVSADDYTNTVQMLGALFQAGVIPQDIMDECIALADVPQSWADMEGVGEVTTRDVGIARGAKA
jgi:hypothetical protein